jgi:hypothetical protein
LHRHGNPHQNLFIIFVDAMFTTLLEQLFTNALDVIGSKADEKLCVSCATRRLTPSQPKLVITQKDRIARMY